LDVFHNSALGHRWMTSSRQLADEFHNSALGHRWMTSSRQLADRTQVARNLGALSVRRWDEAGHVVTQDTGFHVGA